MSDVTTFKAWVKGAVVDSKGELNISIVVPKEMKYDALPITDHGAILQTFEVKIVRAEDFDSENLLEGFELPEGAEFGDGNGEETSRGGRVESPNLYEDKVMPPTPGKVGRKRGVSWQK